MNGGWQNNLVAGVWVLRLCFMPNKGGASLSHLAAAQEFIEKVPGLKTLDALQAEFARSIQGMGFQKFACISIAKFQTPGSITLFDYPMEWFHRYKEQGYIRHDKIVRLSLENSTPFIWSQEHIQKGLTKVQKQIFDEASSLDIVEGITVPVHMRGAFPGSVNVVGDAKDIDPATLHAIHLMGVYLHDSALRIAKKDMAERGHQSELLTDRERECLRWVSIGKTDWEIGEILTLSQNTVHFHIENAKRKLNVQTRTQAVVQAFLQNQILP